MWRDLRTRRGNSRALIVAFAYLALIVGGCSDSKPDKADNGVFDSSRLPRVSGAKEVFASAATTIFTLQDPIAQTADSVDKALAAAGWQKYVAPNNQQAVNPAMRTLTLKKGTQALNVFITVAPAQNNAISVQYSALPLKTDLPFTKDASNIEYSPDRPSLSLITAEPLDKTLDFYRKELGERSWVLWSEKTNAKQAPGGLSGVIHERGAYAHYISDKDPAVTLVLTLQNEDAGKVKVEIKQWPISALEAAHRAYLNRDNSAPLVDVSKLPRLAGAKEFANSSTDRLTYSVPGAVPNTTAALRTLLATDGWKHYVAPLEEHHPLLLTFKRGQQGLSVSFTISPGKTEETTDQTTVSYSPARLQFALPVPEDATDVVFDENRPYLNLSTAGTVDSVREFFNKQLLAADWAPLSAADAAAKWPNATFADKPANGDVAYYVRGAQRAIMLALRARDDGKVNAEIEVPPFALPQTLEADKDIFGLPIPKPHKTAGGTGGQVKREIHAHVPAGTDAVLAFYRRELAARNWREETQGAVINPDDVTLQFAAPDGTAVLKLGHKYDLTTVSLVLQVRGPVVRTEPVAKVDSIDAIMNQAQQMVREATADTDAAMKSQKMAQPSDDVVQTLRPLAGNDTPVPVPETAEDIDNVGSRLAFSSPSSVKAIAEFYRSTMNRQGWQSQSSVINNANMVVLNFTKAGKAVSFTIMKMGNKTNVSAQGSALKTAAATSVPADTAPSNKATTGTSAQLATADDLVAEESGGLPVPKRRTMTEGIKTPFRRELKANVPLDLNVVLEFYRRELGKLNWKEEANSAAVTADSATVAFVSPDGPAVLKLGRRDNETTVHLTLKNPDAAKAAGILPKPGQAKVMFGNILQTEGSLTFNNQTIKVAAQAGTKAPDGPMLDLVPGKYKYSIKMLGQPTQNDDVEVHAEETWGLMIGPGGVLALQAY